MREECRRYLDNASSVVGMWALMPDVFAALESIAATRRDDPLSPLTVIVPSHAAGLQVRRRLVELTPFAGVRFEMLARVAEILAAGHLAAAGRDPLARPIGDYTADQVARESRGTLERVGDLPGYGRALRQIFRRLRRGGIRRAEEAGPVEGAQPAEILRLYDRFREDTSQFYDDEDLLEEAASLVQSGRAAIGDLGAIYVVPPVGRTAGEAALLAAFSEKAPQYVQLDEPVCNPNARFILAPDPASETREVVREVISALDEGVALHEIAVFHGADQSYRRLLREAFAEAEVPVVPLPGIPLTETRVGRGVLSLARLPELDFARTATMDALTVAPIRPWLPGGRNDVRALPAAWDRVSREAGITKGAEQWSARLSALISDLEASARYHQEAGNETRAAGIERNREQAGALKDAMAALFARLEPLREPQPAEDFIREFSRVVDDYLQADAEALEEVKSEIEQLGTVGAVGGGFSLATFTEALRANLEAAFVRPTSLGSGIAITDYRAAAGLRLERVILCGAYEGALPSGPGNEALIDDRVWAALREDHPFIEDASLRIKRAHEAAHRAVSAAGDGSVVWTAPLHEPGGTREYYPSPLMRAAASREDAAIVTASDLRGHPAANGWLRRIRSPLAAALTGPVVSPSDASFRWAIGQRRRGDWFDPQHRYFPPVSMLRSRRSARFTEWDGNLSALRDESWLDLQRAVSPTSLEHYAVCGFRYFARSLLGLRSVEEPEEREMMDAAQRGTLIHHVLERFFRVEKEHGRPAPHEAWTNRDEATLMEMVDDALAEAEERGLTGLNVYSMHEARTIKADLRRFLEEDTIFRRLTGAVPSEFEVHTPETDVAGVKLKGVADRVDVTPDGKQAWVIDYKSGGADEFKEISADDPLAGGKKLQLPVYMRAAQHAESVQAMYWFITKRGGFEFVPYDPSPEQSDAFPRTLEAILAGIRAGSFPAVSGEDDEFYGKFKNCNYCDFDRICSRRRDYEQAAKEDDEAVRPWRGVRTAARGEDGG
jgi:ATP-dependent helicase/nuclease subunit B